MLAEEVHQVAPHGQEPAELQLYVRVQKAGLFPVAEDIGKIPAVSRGHRGHLTGPGRQGLQLQTIGVPVDEHLPPDEPYFDVPVHEGDIEERQGDDDRPTTSGTTTTTTFVIDPQDLAQAGTSGLTPSSTTQN
ncbi:uncharacterized protein LOC111639745 [Centruroides sculpturatus]|uniref:uncharacterized protein LOC111639745 n=1 Tax=Centruroides sculpturatus TaxID=218467 RepID=UPI000C6DBCCC|nr:uncharacterized protein LOC111639745 [Centruroides sculpturatus]